MCVMNILCMFQTLPYHDYVTHMICNRIFFRKYFIKSEIIYLHTIHHHHHHYHVVPPARISLTISRHFSLSFIAPGRSSGLHPVSSHSCCM